MIGWRRRIVQQLRDEGIWVGPLFGWSCFDVGPDECRLSGVGLHQVANGLGLRNGLSTQIDIVVMKDHLQAIVTVLSLVNPTICAAMFSKIEAGRPQRAQLVDATKASIAILVILNLAALFGAQALHQFGISLDAFKVAGGGVLAWMGFGMLAGKSTDSPAPDGSQQGPSLTSLILFAASPGTITGVITIAVDHSRLAVPVTAIIAVFVAVIVTWPLMVAVARFGGHGGQSFVRDTIGRMMGLIVVAMGVQFVLTGIQSFFNGSA